ncbi:uncharacterized protein [Diadema setosum]|uniref:uncharacterized protein n=1 Tax=Diadema setosum TaxID=31175 RepID=UPI003B3B9BD3
MATSVNDLVTSNLQCPICLNTFVDPKLLSCSHTYCKDCLMRLFNSQKEGNITCPVCRNITDVPKENVDLLQCNQPIKSLIEDVKNHTQACTVCRGNEKPLAITYCQECDDYMCADCHKTHNKWDKFAGHEVVKVDDINSGKVSKKKRRECQKHKAEDEEYFCVECMRFVCFRCGMMEHSQAGHKVLDGKAHEHEQNEKISELCGRADVKLSKIDEYIVFIELQEAKMKQVLDKLSREIKQACEESIKQLQEKRDHLIKECTKRIEVFDKELEGMKDASKVQINQIKEMSDLVENGLKMPLEGVTMTAHDTLCQNLEEVLGKSDPDFEQPRKMTLQGESLAFQQTGLNKLNLGEIVILSPDTSTGGNLNSVTRLTPSSSSQPLLGQPPLPSSSKGTTPSLSSSLRVPPPAPSSSLRVSPPVPLPTFRVSSSAPSQPLRVSQPTPSPTLRFSPPAPSSTFRFFPPIPSYSRGTQPPPSSSFLGFLPPPDRLRRMPEEAARHTLRMCSFTSKELSTITPRSLADLDAFMTAPSMEVSGSNPDENPFSLLKVNQEVINLKEVVDILSSPQGRNTLPPLGYSEISQLHVLPSPNSENGSTPLLAEGI